MYPRPATAVLLGLLCAPLAAASPLDDLLSDYRAVAGAGFDAERGARLWRNQVSVDGQTRHCGLCHGQDLTRPGRHERTLKPIEPLAPRANPARLSEIAQIEKWLGRNCRWTWGRDCTASERGDLLTYLRQY